jgi:WD40 repeat protein
MNSGKIQIWDSTTAKVIRELHSHESRVGALAWNSTLLASGSRDRSIFLQDIRVRSTQRTSSSQSAYHNHYNSSSSTNNNNNNVDTPPPSAFLFSSIIERYAAGNPGSGIGTDPSSRSSLITSLSESMLPLTSQSHQPQHHPHSSNSDDTFVFTDPLSNITTGSPGRSSGRHHQQSQHQAFSSPRMRAAAGGSSSLLSSTNSSADPANTSGSVVRELNAHKQEVCGLRWSFDEKLLASGGNDNKLFVWDPQGVAASTTSNSTDSTNSSAAPGGRRYEPLCRFEDHLAAVKAVAWSPHQQGLLASGGGTADRHIRFWNANTNSALHKIDTGSQVCNLMWSKTVNEIVSTHGYSLNQVIIWKYPTMQKLATLSGHTLR